jgi:hypothetical protein
MPWGGWGGGGLEVCWPELCVGYATFQAAKMHFASGWYKLLVGLTLGQSEFRLGLESRPATGILFLFQFMCLVFKGRREGCNYVAYLKQKTLQNNIAAVFRNHRRLYWKDFHCPLGGFLKETGTFCKYYLLTYFYSKQTRHLYWNLWIFELKSILIRLSFVCLKTHRRLQLLFWVGANNLGIHCFCSYRIFGNGMQRRCTNLHMCNVHPPPPTQPPADGHLLFMGGATLILNPLTLH